MAFVDSISKIGDCWSVSESLAKSIEKYVCKLFGATSTTLTEARVELFKRGKFSEELLPPTWSAFLNHLLRANYQAKIWKSSLVANIQAPSPRDHGWLVSEGSIAIDWNVELSADIALLAACSCKAGCKTNACKCKKNGLSCTDACKCIECENKVETNENVVNAENDDEIEDDESDRGEDALDDVDWENEDDIDFTLDL